MQKQIRDALPGIALVLGAGVGATAGILAAAMLTIDTTLGMISGAGLGALMGLAGGAYLARLRPTSPTLLAASASTGAAVGLLFGLMLDMVVLSVVIGALVGATVAIARPGSADHAGSGA